ncbi:MAG: hypothetical protein ACM3VV_04240 [Deltaproteobacteria bacterium]
MKAIITEKDIIEGVKRIQMMNKLLEECSIEELEYLLQVIPMTIEFKRRGGGE